MKVLTIMILKLVCAHNSCCVPITSTFRKDILNCVYSCWVLQLDNFLVEPSHIFQVEEISKFISSSQWVCKRFKGSSSHVSFEISAKPRYSPQQKTFCTYRSHLWGEFPSLDLIFPRKPGLIRPSSSVSLGESAPIWLCGNPDLNKNLSFRQALLWDPNFCRNCPAL
jgi:hypothetical protein